MFRAGYWLIGRWRGAPIKLHWSILLAALILSRFRWSPGFLVAYTGLVLVHELGHAALVLRLGHRVVGVEVTGLGGVCQWSGNASLFEESVIAWGGVLAQLVLFVAAQLWLWFLPPSSDFCWQLLGTLTETNLWLMAVNLMPIAPLDGARAWRIWAAFRERSPGNLPYGSWRDPAPNAQRAWFDKLRAKRRKPSPPAESNADPQGPLSAEAEQAIDHLLKSVTGKARDPARRQR